MSKLDNGIHYFKKDGGYSTLDEGLGYVSIYNNCLHAIDKPALVNQDGTTWMINGKKHRENRPAIELLNGRQEWWLNDKRHRIGGPAIIFENGNKQYYVNGKCSRIDGPAIENADGYKEYWVEGKQLTEEDFKTKYLIQSKFKPKKL